MSQLQDIALSLVGPHEVCVEPVLQPVKVPLDAMPSLWWITVPLSLGSSTKSPRVPSIPLSMLLRKILNSTCSSKALEGHILLIFQLNIEPLIVTRLKWPIHPIIHPSNSSLSNLEVRMLWRTVSKASQKSIWQAYDSYSFACWCSHSIVEGH